MNAPLPTNYRGRNTIVGRAELIYHMLSIGGSRKEVDAVWKPGVEKYLGGTLSELPPQARVYLAPRINEDLDETDVKIASLGDWELDAAKKARDALYLGRPLNAAKILSRRKERTQGSPFPCACSVSRNCRT